MARTTSCCIFPGGRIKDGRIVKVAGLKSPFDIVIDSQNRVWVANSSSDTVVRFPGQRSVQGGELPGRHRCPRPRLGLEGKCLGGEQHGLEDSRSRSFPTASPSWSSSSSLLEHMFKYIMGPPSTTTGAVNMIRPDGTQPAPMGFTGQAINIPWGVNVDGNDDVWVGNYVGPFRGAAGRRQHRRDIPPARRPAMSSTSSRAAASR